MGSCTARAVSQQTFVCGLTALAGVQFPSQPVAAHSFSRLCGPSSEEQNLVLKLTAWAYSAAATTNCCYLLVGTKFKLSGIRFCRPVQRMLRATVQLLLRSVQNNIILQTRSASAAGGLFSVCCGQF